jgi:hypothetical protein
MFNPHRLIAAAAMTGALAIAGPVAAAGATTGVVPPSTVSSVPCFPFPAWCGSSGQPVSWAPWWVRPALGLPPTVTWPPVILPSSAVPVTT